MMLVVVIGRRGEGGVREHRASCRGAGCCSHRKGDSCGLVGRTPHPIHRLEFGRSSEKQ
jgi:hypothetical protein